MPRIRECLIESKNQHGNIRYQFQRGSRGPKIAITGAPEEPVFEDRYKELLSGGDGVVIANRNREDRLTVTGKPQTIEELIAHHGRYQMKKVAQREMSPATETHYSRQLKKVNQLIGQAQLHTIEKHHLHKFIEGRTSTKNSYNNMLRAVKSLFKYGEDHHGLNNPAAQLIKKFVKSDGFRPWSDEDLAKYFGTHKLGTRAHLSIMLLLHAAPRRKDLVYLGLDNIIERDGQKHIRFKPSKSEDSSNIYVDVQFHPHLQMAIDAMPQQFPTFLARHDGKPYTPETMTNYMRKWRKEAGIEHSVTCHGIRKTVGIDLAENEATPYQILSVLGHTSPRATDVYTREAERRRMASQGTAKSTLRDKVTEWVGIAVDHPC